MSLQFQTSQQDWDTHPVLNKNGLFLQSFPQKKLYEELNQPTWMISYKGIKALVTKVEARRGTFLFLPYGPMVDQPEENQEQLQEFFRLLRAFAKEQSASFIRVSPFWEENEQNLQNLKKMGFKKAPIHMLAETLWIVDLHEKSEDDLMAGMEKKHRNLVRRAKKDGVEITTNKDPKAIERFIDLHWQTMSRHNFTPYPKSYFRNQVDFFIENDQVAVLEAWYEGELLASAVVMYFGEIGAYHHGASSSDPKHRKIPASYLLQWEAMRQGQERGMKKYNFWGIAPYTLDEKGKRVYSNPKHPFCGITHFKTGFGGKRMDLVPCHDLVMSPKYALNFVVETTRKWKRGF